MIHDLAELFTAIAALGAFGMSLWNSRKIREVHVSINSRMDQLLIEKGISSKAEGVKEGRASNVD